MAETLEMVRNGNCNISFIFCAQCYPRILCVSKNMDTHCGRRSHNSAGTREWAWPLTPHTNYPVGHFLIMHHISNFALQFELLNFYCIRSKWCIIRVSTVVAEGHRRVHSWSWTPSLTMKNCADCFTIAHLMRSWLYGYNSSSWFQEIYALALNQVDRAWIQY